MFLIVLEAENFKIKAPIDSVSGEGPFPCSQVAVSVRPHMAEESSLGSLYKDTSYS